MTPTDSAMVALETLRFTTAAAQVELDGVLRDLQQARHDLGSTQAAQLLEANEQLVLSALRADRLAETATDLLGEALHKAQRDPLTATPTRAVLQDRLDTALAAARRHGGRLAVIFIDLDHFKLLNDTLGHAAGDAVLTTVARRLEQVLRESDTVCRYGGDEFVVLLPEVGDANDARGVAATILVALDKPVPWQQRQLALSASVGIAVYPEDGGDAQTLISHADAAMYRRKRVGGGGLQLHGGDGDAAAAASAAQAFDAAHERSDSREVDRRMLHLQQANEQLVVAALVAQQQVDSANEAQSRRSSVLSVVAHELRNPLAPIRTAAAVLGRGIADPVLAGRMNAIIERQGAQLAKLIDDLLGGARVSSGNFRIDREVVEIGSVLMQAIETCRPAVATRAQTLTIALLDAPARLHADPARLTQVFTNLLDNASKYTPSGGHIQITAKRSAAEVTVTVSDDGTGIDAEWLPHVFELFVRDTRHVPRHVSGLGIGLAVVRELVLAHGGTVTGSSDGVGTGSSFVVTLPLLADDAPAP